MQLKVEEFPWARRAGQCSMLRKLNGQRATGMNISTVHLQNFDINGMAGIMGQWK